MSQEDHGQAAGPFTLGTAARFVLGALAALGALGLAIAVEPALRGGPLTLVACVGAAGAAASLGGLAAFVGAWLALVAPWVVLALLSGQECVVNPFILPLGSICPRPWYLLLAGVGLVGGFVVLAAGFVVARAIRWALTEPPEAGP